MAGSLVIHVRPSDSVTVVLSLPPIIMVLVPFNTVVSPISDEFAHCVYSYVFVSFLPLLELP